MLGVKRPVNLDTTHHLDVLNVGFVFIKNKVQKGFTQRKVITFTPKNLNKWLFKIILTVLLLPIDYQPNIKLVILIFYCVGLNCIMPIENLRIIVLNGRSIW